MTSPSPKTLFVVLSEVAPEHEADFNRWYDEEHVPERLSCPGFLTARRYRAAPGIPGGKPVQGEPRAPRYLAVYEVTGPEVLQTEEYRRQIATPTEWTLRIQRNMAVQLRHAYEPIGHES
jgi:hypothetical protein